MKVVNFFVKLLSYFFTLVFLLLCLTTTIFLMIKNMISYDNVSSYVKNANIFDYSSQEVENNKGKTLRQTIQEDLLKMDIPVLVTDAVLDSSETNKMISDYIYNYSHYVLFNEKKPSLPKDSIVTNVENKYMSIEGKGLSPKQKENVSNYVSTMGNKVDKNIFDKAEVSEVVKLDIIKKIAQMFNAEYIVYAFGIIVLLLFVIISLCLGSIKKAINWCGKSIILDGVLLIILSFVEVKFLIMYFNSQGLVDNFAILVIEQGFKNMLLYGGILIVIGLILVSISAIMLKKEKSRESKALLKETISKEVENSKSNKENNSKNQNIEKNQKETKKQDLQEEKKEELQLEDKDDDSQSVLKNEKGKNPKENKNEIKDKDKMEIVPVPDEKKEQKEGKNDKNIQTNDYIEIDDVKDDLSKPDNTNVNVFKINPISELDIEITHPEKGKDIQSKEEEDEEEIEVL